MKRTLSNLTISIDKSDSNEVKALKVSYNNNLLLIDALDRQIADLIAKNQVVGKPMVDSVTKLQSQQIHLLKQIIKMEPTKEDSIMSKLKVYQS